MTYFVLLGVLLYKREEDNSYLFKHEDQLSTISAIMMLAYMRQELDIDNRLALFSSTFYTWFFYADDSGDDFKVPFREVYEYV